MKNKGFTLIELLAVIVILAIIALIATPIIILVVNNAKEESDKRSIEMYAKAIENAVVTHQLTKNENIAGSFNTTDGENLILIGETEPKLTIDYNGNVVCNTIEIYADGTLYLANCKVNKEEVETIYGNKASFATDDWGTILSNIKAGYMYEVGQTREISLTGFTNKEENSNGLYTIRIANTSTQEECDTEGFSQTACGFVIEFVDVITKHNMNSGDTDNPYGTNVGGWRDSEMRNYVNSTIYNSIPIELRNNTLDTYVVSGHGPTTGEENFETIDKLYLLSPKEVWGTNSGTSANQTRQLDYYENIDDDSNIKKYHNGSLIFWWLRSAFIAYSDTFFIVNGYGGSTGRSAFYGFGVAPAFRIG